MIKICYSLHMQEILS